jgi:hypothetical protein
MNNRSEAPPALGFMSSVNTSIPRPGKTADNASLGQIDTGHPALEDVVHDALASVLADFNAS